MGLILRLIQLSSTSGKMKILTSKDKELITDEFFYIIGQLLYFKTYFVEIRKF